jgi:transcription elongation factor GreA
MRKENSLVLTAEGYLELEEELNELKTVQRPDIIRALKDARAQGDLSENADYDAARASQAQIEARIKELEYRLEHSEIASNVSKGEVCVGSTVTVKDEDGEEDTYKIVGSVEADSFNNKISNESPIGKALLGHRENEKVMVESPNGEYSILIVKVA